MAEVEKSAFKHSHTFNEQKEQRNDRPRNRMKRNRRESKRARSHKLQLIIVNQCVPTNFFFSCIFAYANNDFEKSNSNIKLVKTSDMATPVEKKN